MIAPARSCVNRRSLKSIQGVLHRKDAKDMKNEINQKDLRVLRAFAVPLPTDAGRLGQGSQLRTISAAPALDARGAGKLGSVANSTNYKALCILCALAVMINRCQAAKCVSF
jgi:hypothetical protein